MDAAGPIRLPATYFRRLGMSDIECEAYESAFPDGAVIGLGFVDFCASSGIDIDGLARMALSGRHFKRYESFYSMARASCFGTMARERPSDVRREQIVETFKRDCGVIFVGCLLRMAVDDFEGESVEGT